VYLTPEQVAKIKGFGSKNSFGGYLSSAPIYNCLTASYAVDGGNSMKFFRNGRISALSPVECERLQGFPDNWTVGVSTNQRYKTLGNAVTTNVIEELVKSIARALEEKGRERIESVCER
jgi:site-specific DNA-cytosine methylase